MTILIKRDTYTKKSITSTITVTSDKTTKSFKGYTLENAKAGTNHNKAPIPAGSYKAKTRSDGKKGWRVELKKVKGYTHIEIHKGNFPSDSQGCFLPGTSRTSNKVRNSTSAMKAIKSVVKADKSGDITVQVVGPPTQP